MTWVLSVVGHVEEGLRLTNRFVSYCTYKRLGFHECKKCYYKVAWQAK